ncbi:MAG: hypothetical protein ACLQU4_08150 [Limisphaerales bacterium]
MSFSVFAVCAFVRFLTFADFSKTMLRKHTKSIQDESSGSLPGISRGCLMRFGRECGRIAVPLPCFWKGVSCTETEPGKIILILIATIFAESRTTASRQHLRRRPDGAGKRKAKR